MILEFLFPRQCLQCNKFGKYICEGCFKKVAFGGCDKYNYSVFRYEGIIKKAIISLKYKFATDMADELTEKIVNSLITNKQFLNKKFALVPIPLHKHRENWRGFNQAGLIGEKLAEEMNWKFISDLLIRTKNTIPQVGLKGLARRSNLSDVFCLNPNRVLSTMYSVLLFDDVYTTGSTINEARKVLQRAGFKNVKSLTIAR